MEHLISDLIELWDQYQKQVIETNPHWTDMDFNFSDFMDWLKKRS